MKKTPWDFGVECQIEASAEIWTRGRVVKEAAIKGFQKIPAEIRINKTESGKK